MKLLVAQIGARHHYAIPRILHRAGLLEHFCTDIAVAKGWPAIAAVVSLPLCKDLLVRLRARSPGGIPAQKTSHWPWFGLQYWLRRSCARSGGELTGVWLWAGSRFCRLVIRRGLGSATGVYVFNGAGLELLEHARERGLFRVMEQTIVPAQIQDRLLSEEEATNPGWEPPRGKDPYRAEFAGRERAEWALADLIVCGSEFVREGVRKAGGPVERCAVVPYGVDLPVMPPRGVRTGGPLRLLVAGAVCLRKGAPYVLRAAQLTRGLAELRWCGGVAILPEAARGLKEHVDLRGSVPRPQMTEHYAWADVFLLPSICEGSATVCYEALAAGLPVITTPNAGSVVRDGVDGFIVPIRDAEAIAQKLELLARNPDLLEEMSRNARERAREFTVEKYGERLVAALEAGCRRCQERTSEA